MCVCVCLCVCVCVYMCVCMCVSTLRWVQLAAYWRLYIINIAHVTYIGHVTPVRQTSYKSQIDIAHLAY